MRGMRTGREDWPNVIVEREECHVGKGRYYGRQLPLRAGEAEGEGQADDDDGLPYCTGCQKMTSSAFSLSSLYPLEAFEVSGLEPEIGGLHGDLRHFFCPHCMSWMFTRFDGMGPFVNIRSALLDDFGGFRPFIESYTSEKLPWAETPARHSYPKFPPMEDFPGLMAEFAQSGN